MGKGVMREYQRLSPEDKRTFDRWLRTNAILGPILAVGMLAMALAGSGSVGRTDAAIADSSRSSNVAAPIEVGSRQSERR
jgi:hypothetical protein